MDDERLFSPHRAHVLDNEARLSLVDEPTMMRLLALEGDEDIADLGSGTGFWTNRVAGWTTGTVYAVDAQPEMHEKHRAHGTPRNVHFVLGDLDELPLPALSVDRAFSVSTFHEAHKPGGLARLAAALRPGGRVVVADWRRSEGGIEYGPPMRFRLTKEEAADALNEYFQPVSAEDLNDLFYAVVAIRR